MQNYKKSALIIILIIVIIVALSGNIYYYRSKIFVDTKSNEQVVAENKTIDY